MKRSLVLAIVLAACGTDAPPQTYGAVMIGPSGIVQTTTAGLIDPTSTAYAGGMVACSSSCSGATADQNRAALTAAFTAACSQGMDVYAPPGSYPVSCTSGQSYGVDLGTCSNLHFKAYNATFRFQGAAGGCAMFLVHNDSNVRFEGMTFSGRDVTGGTNDTLLMKVGDGGLTNVSDVQLTDVHFTEGVSGDYLRLDGGATSTVSAVTVSRSFFNSSARVGIDVRGGVSQTSIVWNFFHNNSNRAIYFEPQSAGPMGSFNVNGNIIESQIAPAVTLSGYSSAQPNLQSTFNYNHVIPTIGSTTGGGTVEMTNVGQLAMKDDTIIWNGSTIMSDALTNTAPNLDIVGSVVDVTADNVLTERDGAATNASPIHVVSSGGASPANVTLRSCRVLQYSGIAPGIDLSGAIRSTVDECNITYHGATADSGSTGFSGIYCSGTTAAACGGVLHKNRITQDDQAIQASLDLSTVTVTPIDTVVQARQPGQFGNTITVKLVADTTSNPGVLAETGTPLNAVTIHYHAAGTTVTQLETLITDNSSLLTIKTHGTGSRILASGDAFGPTALSGALQAARPLAGIRILKGAGTTVNRLTVRDNWVNGARDVFYMDADGSAAYPEGYPLIAGNQSTSITNEFEGGITTWRTETTGNSEPITSGALSPAKAISFLTTTGTVAYTLADGTQSGFRKCVRITSSSGNGTLTPTHFADGSTHTYTWSTCNSTTNLCNLCLTWDDGSTTWRDAGHSSAVTLN